ncbi:hypothetical protein GCM10023229_09190 [Flavisolibacter ginsenosidimutans]
MRFFKADISIIDINPFVLLPQTVLQSIVKEVKQKFDSLSSSQQKRNCTLHQQPGNGRTR